MSPRSYEESITIIRQNKVVCIAVTYRVVQVSGSLNPDNESTLPHTIISATPSLSSSQQIQTVFTNPLNGEVTGIFIPQFYVYSFSWCNMRIFTKALVCVD